MFFIAPTTSAVGMYTCVNVALHMFLIAATSAQNISTAMIAATSTHTTSTAGMYTHVNVHVLGSPYFHQYYSCYDNFHCQYVHTKSGLNISGYYTKHGTGKHINYSLTFITHPSVILVLHLRNCAHHTKTRAHVQEPK